VIWSRSLELIDRMGCGASFVEAGLKATASNIIAGGRQIGHIRLDGAQTPHPYALMLPQSETERLMEEHLKTCGVQVERQVELARFTAERDRVTAALRHANGQEETVGYRIIADVGEAQPGAHQSDRRWKRFRR
jgi:2-polyprenyl-6-methoxyphenol hydroxylase-like FAD-dependent oxidoreductase